MCKQPCKDACAERGIQLYYPSCGWDCVYNAQGNAVGYKHWYLGNDPAKCRPGTGPDCRPSYSELSERCPKSCYKCSYACTRCVYPWKYGCPYKGYGTISIDKGDGTRPCCDDTPGPLSKDFCKNVPPPPPGDTPDKPLGPITFRG